MSSNAVTWVEHAAPVGSWQSLAFGADRDIALSPTPRVHPTRWLSSNGLNWTVVRGLPPTPHLWAVPDKYGQWNAVAYAYGEFAAVSAVGTIATSVNGLSWKVHFFRSNDDFTSITAGDGRFVVIDDSRRHRDVSGRSSLGSGPPATRRSDRRATWRPPSECGHLRSR